MKRRKVRDMLERRIMRGREVVVLTIRWSAGQFSVESEGGLRFWLKASWSERTLSNSSARSEISFKMYWEKSSTHLVLPRTIRSTSKSLACCMLNTRERKLTRIMRLRLSTLVVLEEISKQDGSMAKMQNRPRDSGHEIPWLESIPEAKSSLDAKASRDIRMIHEFVLFHGKVAVDGQCTVYFVKECVLGFYKSLENEK